MTFIKDIKKENNKITLYRCPEPFSEILISTGEIIQIAILDVETTGLNYQNDEIIELAVKVLSIEKNTGKILNIVNSYESFNEPVQPINNMITKITGIDKKMVSGKSINWSILDQILKSVNIIISHNASFDRPFIEKHLKLSRNKLWGCSIKDINWLERGFVSNKQEMLCFWHGFYFDAHRAMNDVDALIHLITHPYYQQDKPILDLINNSKIEQYFIWVINFPFNVDKKDKIKSNGYYWNNEKKLWFKKVEKKDLEEEKEYLKKIVYNDTFKGEVELISPENKYKI
jgi:DNA polymerase-3 subunit epsilon